MSSPLNAASASQGKPSLIKLLIAAKVHAAKNPNPDPSHDPRRSQKLGLIMRVESQGYAIGSALCAAATEGYVDVLRYFIDKANANPNAGSLFGETPLFVAAEYGQIDSLRYLLTVGDPSLPDRHGRTPLMAAASKGHTEACSLLARHANNFKTSQRTPEGWTALMFASQGNHHACVPALAGCCRLGMRDKEGRDALSVAAGRDHAEFIQALLALRPRPTDASIARAIEAARCSSFDPSHLNLAGRVLMDAQLMRKELREIGSAALPSKKIAAAKAPRL